MVTDLGCRRVRSKAGRNRHEREVESQNGGVETLLDKFHP